MTEPPRGPVAVVGATGTVGQRVVRRLLARGARVRAVTRRPDALPTQPGLDVVGADLRKPDAAERALAGARWVYLTPPESGYEDPLAAERDVAGHVVEAARRSNVEHLVLHTALHADRGTTGARMLDAKAPLERAVALSGVPFTILRPGWFMQNWLSDKPWLERGTLRMPLPPDRPLGAVSAEDVAALAVEAFAAGPRNRGFDVHLPGNLTPRQFCEAVEEVRGAVVRYEEWTGSMFDYLAAAPTTPAHKELYAEFLHYLRRERYAGRPLEAVAAYRGFRYTGVSEFIRNELFPGAPPREADRAATPPTRPEDELAAGEP